MHAHDYLAHYLAQIQQTRELIAKVGYYPLKVPMSRMLPFLQAPIWYGSGVQASSVVGRGAGGAHAAIKQQKAQLASLIARLRTQRQACQVPRPPP